MDDPAPTPDLPRWTCYALMDREGQLYTTKGRDGIYSTDDPGEAFLFSSLTGLTTWVGDRIEEMRRRLTNGGFRPIRLDIVARPAAGETAPVPPEASHALDAAMSRHSIAFGDVAHPGMDDEREPGTWAAWTDDRASIAADLLESEVPS